MIYYSKLQALALVGVLVGTACESEQMKVGPGSEPSQTPNTKKNQTGTSAEDGFVTDFVSLLRQRAGEPVSDPVRSWVTKTGACSFSLSPVSVGVEDQAKKANREGCHKELEVIRREIVQAAEQANVTISGLQCWLVDSGEEIRCTVKVDQADGITEK